MTSATGEGKDGKSCPDLQRRGSIYMRKKEKEKKIPVRVCAGCFKSLQALKQRR